MTINRRSLADVANAADNRPSISLDDFLEHLPIPFAWHPTKLNVFAVGAHHSTSVLLSTPVETAQQQKRLQLSSSGIKPKCLFPTKRVSEREIESSEACQHIIFTEEHSHTSHIMCLAFGKSLNGYRLAVGTNIGLEMWKYKESEEAVEANNRRSLSNRSESGRELRNVAAANSCQQPINSFTGNFEQEIVEIDPYSHIGFPVTALAWSNQGDYLIVTVYDGSVFVVKSEFRIYEDSAVWFAVKSLKLRFSRPLHQSPSLQFASSPGRYIHALSFSPTLPIISMLSTGGDVILVDSTNWDYKRWSLPRKRGSDLIMKINWIPSKLGGASFIVGTTQELYEFRFAVNSISDIGNGETFKENIQMFPLQFDTSKCFNEKEFERKLQIQDFSIDPVNGTHVAILFEELPWILIYRIVFSAPIDPIVVFEFPLVVFHNPTSQRLLSVQFSSVAASGNYSNIHQDYTSSSQHQSRDKEFPEKAEEVIDEQRSESKARAEKLGRSVYLAVVYSSPSIDGQVQLDVSSNTESSTAQQLSKQEVKIFQVKY